MDIVVVGSGFAGLGMGIRLRRAGRHDFLILEQASSLGGTWRDNVYPGCACDVPSPLYSYSFAQNPRWSRLFSPQPEILGYLADTARREGLEPHLRYDATVTAATYDAIAQVWRVDVNGAASYTCRALVLGVGALHVPQVPALSRLADYRGTTFHSSAWRHDEDLTGKRVAVVGTGASAVQIVPEIARVAGHLDVYQRTPAWILPKPDRRIGVDEQRLYQRYPLAQRALRDLLYWVLEVRGMGFTVSPRLASTLAGVSRRHLARQVPDHELRDKLTPHYQIGCKRLLISSHFYPALQRPNVDLVTDTIDGFTPTGLRTIEGTERPADTVVFATGFNLQANLECIRVTGIDGHTLEEVWAEQGVNAHLGLMVSGFPNLFMLLGPNTGLGHNSVVFMIEAQIGFVLRALAALDSAGARRLDIRADAQRRSVRKVQDRLTGTVWQSGCRSWYLDASGRNYAIWPRTSLHYWLALRRLERRDYEFASAPAGYAQQIEELETQGVVG